MRLPLDDYLRGLRVCLDGFHGGRLAVVAGTLVLSWWIYVPLHELAHALGCVAAGGEVTRLEIDGLYGAAFLQQFFPFVTVGSEYAGRLSGFETRGSDLTYLATDFLPFLLTILLGVPLLRSAGTPGRRPWAACVRLGVSLPIAYAPFISVTGDFYEMGSIVVSRLTTYVVPALEITRWRGDDLFKLAGALFAKEGGGTLLDAAGLVVSFGTGVVLAFATYGLGALWSSVLLGGCRRDRPVGAS